MDLVDTIETEICELQNKVEAMDKFVISLHVTEVDRT
jgi:hypothetical protein